VLLSVFVKEVYPKAKWRVAIGFCKRSLPEG